MNAMDERSAAEALLQRVETVYLSILDGDGYPVACPMEKAGCAGLRQVLLVTKRASEKLACLRRAPRCGVEADDGEAVLTLRGEMEIIEDAASLRALLDEARLRRLEVRGMDAYCLLRFRTAGARYVRGGRAWNWNDFVRTDGRE